jgi:hypothetical protein
MVALEGTKGGSLAKRLGCGRGVGHRAPTLPEDQSVQTGDS